jgi:hypothetical protein
MGIAGVLKIGLIVLGVGLLLYSYISIYRLGKKNGYREGEDDTNKIWINKQANIYDRATNPADDGVGVQSPDAKWEVPGTSAPIRMEPQKGADVPMESGDKKA